MWEGTSGCERALRALLSLWCYEGNHAFRSTENRSRDMNTNLYYPSATSQAIVAFAECGIWHSETKRSKIALETPELSIAGLPAAPPEPQAVLTRLTNNYSEEWFGQIYAESSHLNERKLIVISVLLQVLSAIISAPYPLKDDEKRAIQNGVHGAEEKIKEIINPPTSAQPTIEEHTFSPYLLFKLTICLDELARIREYVHSIGFFIFPVPEGPMTQG